MVDRPMGYCAEKSVKDFGISRDEQDSYAIESYQKAQKAWKVTNSLRFFFLITKNSKIFQ